MSTVVSRLEAVLTAQTRDFDRAMDKSSTKMQKVGHASMRAGLAITGGVVAGLGLSVKAAIDSQTSQSRLDRSFKNSGLSMSRYTKQLDAATKAGRALGFTDDDTRTSLGSLIVATKSYRVAARQLAIAQDVARFKGIDLATATKLLTSASAGGQRALKQLGLSIQPFTGHVDKVKIAYRNLTKAQRENTEDQYNANLEMAKLIDKHKTMNMVVELVRQKLKGQSQAYAQTAAGGIAVYRAEMNHLETEMGTGLIPALTKLATSLSVATKFMSEHKTVTKILTIATAALGLAFLATSLYAKAYGSTLITKVIPYLVKTTAAQWLMNAALTANPIGVVIVSLAALVAIMIVLERKYGILTTAVKFLTKHWQLLLIPIGLIPAAIALVITKFDLIHVAVQALNAGLHAMKRVLDKIVDIFKWIIDKAGAVSGAVGGIAGAIGGAAGAVAGKLNPRGEGGPPAGARGPVGGDMGQIVGAANAIDSKRFPYLWGGGHSGSTMNGPYDCSGAVSALLRAGGLMSGSMVSGDFMSYGKPGMGKHISILANPEHVYTLINGKAWGTSGQNPGGGAGWFSGGVRSGFAIRHPEGFDTGGWLKPGLTLAMNNTGRPERVLGPGEGGVVNFNFPNYVGSRQELMSVMREAARQFQTRNGRDPL